MSLSRFVMLWTHSDYPPARVKDAEIDLAESQLSTRFPTDYLSAVRSVGLPHPSIGLLNAIVDREMDLHDVSAFLAPAEMVTMTSDWRDLGLSEELVAFATDCMGNLFCFPVATEPHQHAPVLFFDHVAGGADVISSSFSDWIEELCKLESH